MPPPSSGGIAIIEALNILETYEFLPAFNGASYKHLLTEALRRPPALIGGTHTTHYSVVDGEGNAVATTTTLNGAAGSGT